MAKYKPRYAQQTPKPARALKIAWILLVVIILLAAGFGAWQMVVSNLLATSRAEKLLAAFDDDCLTSDVAAVLEMPAISANRIPVLDGIDAKQLASGVGRYPTSAEPGAQGNTVLVGYRLFDGQPFHDLLKLAAGDEITLTTCDASYHYQIVVAPKDLTVNKDDSWVLDAVPDEPGQMPSAPMLTLITNQDLLPTADRAVGFAKYIGAD